METVREGRESRREDGSLSCVMRRNYSGGMMCKKKTCKQTCIYLHIYSLYTPPRQISYTSEIGIISVTMTSQYKKRLTQNLSTQRSQQLRMEWNNVNCYCNYCNAFDNSNQIVKTSWTGRTARDYIAQKDCARTDKHMRDYRHKYQHVRTSIQTQHITSKYKVTK